MDNHRGTFICGSLVRSVANLLCSVSGLPLVRVPEVKRLATQNGQLEHKTSRKVLDPDQGRGAHRGVGLQAGQQELGQDQGR